MNILDKIATVLNMPEVKKGYIPNKPDAVVCLFEYSDTPPSHFFSSTDIIHNVQVRIRDINSTAAYAKAEAVVLALNRYSDNEISVIQSTPIVDIGYDDANPQRQEYTVNFEIRRY